jgi:hypothetical protein
MAEPERLDDALAETADHEERTSLATHRAGEAPYDPVRERAGLRFVSTSLTPGRSEAELVERNLRGGSRPPRLSANRSGRTGRPALSRPGY